MVFTAKYRINPHWLSAAQRIFVDVFRSFNRSHLAKKNKENE